MFLSLVRPDRISWPITRMDAVTISVMSQFLILPEPCPGAVLMSSGYADQTCSVQPFFKAARRQPCELPTADAYRAGAALATISFRRAVWSRPRTRSGVNGICVRRNEWGGRHAPSRL